MVERHPYTVDTGVQFSNEVPKISGIGASGNTGPCQGSVASSILASRSKLTKENYAKTM